MPDILDSPVDPTPPVSPPPPTQTIYPWRATLRTSIQTFVGVVVTLGVIIPAIIAIVADDLDDYLPDRAIGWLLAASGIVAAVAGAVGRIMAIPAVEAWLQGGAVRSTLAAKPPGGTA